MARGPGATTFVMGSLFALGLGVFVVAVRQVALGIHRVNGPIAGVVGIRTAAEIIGMLG
jgi:hypothetical protein